MPAFVSLEDNRHTPHAHTLATASKEHTAYLLEKRIVEEAAHKEVGECRREKRDQADVGHDVD